MTTLLEPPTILGAGKPPNTFESDAPLPGAPAERESTEDGDEEAEEEDV